MLHPFAHAFYRAYVTALIAGMAVLAASGWLGDERASVASQVLAHDGAAVLAVVSAVAIAAGLRSGARGGPFAVEAGARWLRTSDRGRLDRTSWLQAAPGA